jgi:hypothetical protein
MDPRAQVSSESNRASKRKSIFTSTSTERCRSEKRTRRTGGLLSGTETGNPHVVTSAQFSLPVNEYSYKPLEDGHVRLLRLSAEESGEGPVLSMVHVSLDEAPQYDALSYCWGTDPAIHPVQIDNKTLYVRSNLYQALRHIRTSEQGRFVWIDALCINQDDVAERNTQVAKMADIFRNVERVIAWLGAETAYTKVAFDFIQEALQPGFLQGETWLLEHKMAAFRSLLKNDLFSRVWVVQEIALAKEVLLRCGTHESHFLDLVDAVSLIRTKLDSLEPVHKCLANGEPFPELLHQWSGVWATISLLNEGFFRSSDGTILGNRMSLQDLVTGLVHCQTTDPRDTLYALLGMAKDMGTSQGGISTQIKADYSLSVLDTFSNFMATSIRSSASLDLICRPWAPQSRTPWKNGLVDPDLRYAVPSWIPVREQLPFGDPKYQSQIRVNAEGLVGPATKKVYNASDNRPAEARFGIDDVSKCYNGSLYAKGIILGRVDELSVRMADGIVNQECFDLIGGVERNDHGKLEGIEDSLWRILTANRGPNGERVPSLFRIALLHLLQQYPKMTSLDTIDLCEKEQPEHIEDFLRHVQSMTWNRRVFVSENALSPGSKWRGLVPRHTRAGDMVCILFGASVPIVLRAHETQSRKCWEIVGEAYVDCAMDGEAFCCLDKQGLKAATLEFEIR